MATNWTLVRWLLVMAAAGLACSCSGDGSSGGGPDTVWGDSRGMDFEFGHDQRDSDVRFGQQDSASKDTAEPDEGPLPDLRGDDVQPDCGAACADLEDDDVAPDVAKTPCEVSWQCDKGSVQSEACGNCGTRTRPCDDQCQYGPWSECLDQGECAFGQREEKGCGDTGLQHRDCLQTCTWDNWTECEEQGVCLPGQAETEACGNCGQRYRGCTEGLQWDAWSPCQNQGVCAPDATTDMACGNCGTQTATCGTDCQWGEPGECTGEGVCLPGTLESEACGNCGTRTRACTDQCNWPEAWGECSGEGECTPLDTETTTCGKCGTTSRKCTGSCQWGDFDTCEGQGECLAGQWLACNNCGYQTCSDSCQWGECVIGEVDAYEQNDSQAAAYDLGSMGDNEQNQTLGANINPTQDSDWYKIVINDLSDADINPRFTLKNVPAGQTYHIYVTYDCLMSDKVFSGDLVVTGTGGPASGTLSLDVSGCYKIFIIENNSGTAYIRIESESTGSCEYYELNIIA